MLVLLNLFLSEVGTHVGLFGRNFGFVFVYHVSTTVPDYLFVKDCELMY